MTATGEHERICLDIGTTCAPDGYTAIDITNGQLAEDLQYADGTVDEIRASHILEHFSHKHSLDVMRHWVAKLKPGGRLRVAVPDFEQIAKRYLNGEPFDVQGYTMGSHANEHEHHGAIFDAETVREMFLTCGLERCGPWESEFPRDGASLTISLNLQAFKPMSDAKPNADYKPGEGFDLVAVLSAPRYGPMLHVRCALTALANAGVPYRVTQGAYWHQCITEAMEAQIAEKARYILTCDYDSIFCRDDVLELYRLMEAEPEADAICALESKRGSDHALFQIPADDTHAAQEGRQAVWAYKFDRHLTRLNCGHFGLTIFRASSLDELPRPWMTARPNEQGRWDDGHTDHDIDFWQGWNRAGKTLFLASRVVIGHLEEVIGWPASDMRTIYQSVSDYVSTGVPKEVWSKCQVEYPRNTAS